MASATTPGLSLSLTGKVALVTGGSRGIGAATVRLLRQAGARVVFSYRSAADQANALVGECGGEEFCRAIQQDLATIEDGQALIAAAIAVFGRLDILVVNHGVWPSHDQPIATMPTSQWSTTLGINLASVFGLVQSATAQMLSQPLENRSRGHIVLVASTAAQRGEAFHADYAASKGALLSLTKSLSSELAPAGHPLQLRRPRLGPHRHVCWNPKRSNRVQETLDLIPLGRVADPDEIAAPIVFLCTPWAGFISGEIFNVNGGAVLAG